MQMNNIWEMAFDQIDIVFYYGIATLFGEEEQELYPSRETYSKWREETYFYLRILGLDKYCVASILEELDSVDTFSCFV